MLELLNRYAHGLVAVPILHALRTRGVLARLHEAPCDPATLARACEANPGYFSAAIRMLVALEWLRPLPDGRYAATADLAQAAIIPADILDLYEFQFDDYARRDRSRSLDPWFDRVARRWDSPHPFLTDYLDGVLIVPWLLALEAGGHLRIDETSAATDRRPRLRLDLAPGHAAEVARLFVAKGWADGAPDDLRLTRAGRFIVDRILITGTVASYRPMLGRAADLLFGDHARVFDADAAGHETHLERTLNVTASGFQHEKYFAALDETLVRLFDHDDYDRQPIYVADMGCGDGTLLRRLYETVRTRTRRGTVLDRHPLILVAVDRHAKALAAAARTLAGLPHLTVTGDIGDPMALLDSLRAAGIADLDRVLHVRSFMDHNRSLLPPSDRAAAARRMPGGATNVYIDSDGTSIPAAEVIQSTVEHLQRWAAIATTHGLLVLEVHCLTPAVTARMRDVSESFHFDLYHALSHQYLLEAQTFLLCAAEAGLFCGAGQATRFPQHLPFTRITLNHFQPRPYRVRHAVPDDRPSMAGFRELIPHGAAVRPVDRITPPIGRSDEADEQFVLEIAGTIAAVVRGAVDPSTSAFSIAGVAVAPGCPETHVLDLLEFVAQYWSYATGGSVCDLDRWRTAASPVSALARDVAAHLTSIPFDPQDDPRVGEAELGTFSFHWLLAILQRMGVMREAGEVYDRAQLVQRLGVAAKYEAYFDALLRRLDRLGLLTRTGDRIETTALVRDWTWTSIDDEVAAFTTAFRSRYPACVGLLQFTSACLRRYDEILTGRVEVTDVLFEGADMGVFAGIFRGDVVADYFNHIVAELLKRTVTRAGTPLAPIQILEIGGGTGGTTSAILEALRPHAGRVRYCFSDISPAFVRHARRRFVADDAWVEYRTLNIDEELDPQGFAPRTFDVIVAANVLHDTRDIEQTLIRTRGLLKPGGSLLLNEYTSVKDCLCFSGALLHGWWLFEDPARRLPDSCLMSVPQWARALEHTGFAPIEYFTLPTQRTTGDCSQCVMLCASADPPARAVAETARTVQEVVMPDSGAVRPDGAVPAGTLAAWTEREILMLLGPARASAYDAERPIMEMGLDSIELVELKLLLEQRFEVSLASAFFFEHETPARIVAALEPLVGSTVRARLTAADDPPAGQVISAPGLADRAMPAQAMAIVGLACRFPGEASSPQAFWRILEQGVSCVGPMSAPRWQWPAGLEVEAARRALDRGGFMPRIDAFDASFFRISPREAELMDPQQRLLLELSWEALEDAAHRPSELAGRTIGVFVGACHHDYRELLAASGRPPDAYLGSGNAPSMLANRLSYFYDFTGPSLTIDTACSSALFALHDAVRAIARGECEQALVGAVNLICSPTNTLTYAEAGMLSASGVCRAFDAAADGFVRGEGGAMLLIKPLAAALADGDAIHGVVTGVATNHAGQAASLTAPRPDAQAAVVEAAWREAGAAPESAGYIETHGTGTRLGDPIEIKGLIEGFARLSAADGWRSTPNWCGIGAVKTNIGHLEGAAGLAGLIKVLLALRHGVIPRTLHFTQLNPEIDLHGQPFHVVAQNERWPERHDAQGRMLPRRAGISSFGFGGANAHVVVEDYRPLAGVVDAGAGPVLIPLSARSPEQLIAVASRLLDALSSPDAPAATAGGTLRDLAYTLQVGREPMAERLALIVDSRDALLSALRSIVAGETEIRGVVRGSVSHRRHMAVAGAAAQETTTARATPAQADLVCAASWCGGAPIDWLALYRGQPSLPRRVPLPTYPFLSTSFWAASAPDLLRSAPLHPLVHRNSSDLDETRYSSTFTGSEPLLADHRVRGHRWLPAVACLEMARDAVTRAAGDGVIALTRLVWLRPIEVRDRPLEVHIAVLPGDTGARRLLGFEIYSHGGDEADEDILHARGVAVSGQAAVMPHVDVAALAMRYERGHHGHEACYAAFAARELDYGPSYRGLEGLRIEGDEVIARVALPSVAVTIGEPFYWHPALLDAALQATMGFSVAEGGSTVVAVPFELERAEILLPSPAQAWVVVRRLSGAGGRGVDRYDLDLSDDAGRVCVRLRGLAMRRVDQEASGLADETGAATVRPLAASGIPGVDAGRLERDLRTALARAISTVLQTPVERIPADAPFSALGFDSIGYAELAEELKASYGLDLMPTVFFEHPTLERFAAFLMARHQTELAARLAAPRLARTDAGAGDPAIAPPATSMTSTRTRARRVATPRRGHGMAEPVRVPIAIVGVSGRFPMAPDPDALWDNLMSGRDCISEIPPERWDWRAVAAAAGGNRDRSSSPLAWAGLIDGIDEFDPQFFNISPREAQLMDPQQRLLMTYIWKALEDAGYAPSSLSGTDTGIFVGTGLSDYDLLVSRSGLAIDAYTATGTVSSVGPNRMSYFLNLHGPSEPIETLCSSSLVAVHRAVEAIRYGHCSMAIAGGVNTIVSPDLHVSCDRAGMLSPDGHCKTFSDRADGYVRSEGIGILLLKPLAAAEAAGDHIYGVILGSAENHGGRAVSFSAPNPEAQAALLRRAYTDAGVDPATISYIEAHGTGTALGDPIEVEGLKTAFRDLYAARGATAVPGHCGLGSVKSNIGHTELAAGAAGLIKVLWQLQHATLVPSVHCERINPYIQLEGSPFYLVRDCTPWPVAHDAEGRPLPRRAGVSAFGYGGVNAHVIVEEYVPPVARIPAAPAGAVAFVLSARDATALPAQAEALLDAIRRRRFDEGDLVNLAYTLQIGRDAMDERVGFVAGSIVDLEAQLQRIARGETAAGLHRGHVRRDDDLLAVLGADEEFEGMVDRWIAQGRLEKLLELWVKGLRVDWPRLYGEAVPSRIAAPTYVFARERHWVPSPPADASSRATTPASGSTVCLHPLVHRNTSDLIEQRYSTTFTGNEPWLADHRVGGRRWVPATACLEMAREAVARAAGRPVSGLTAVAWLRPIVVEAEPVEVHIAVVPGDDDAIAFEIYSGDTLHVRGLATVGDAGMVPRLDVHTFETRLRQSPRYGAQDVYAAFLARGIEYGPGSRGLEAVHVLGDEATARIARPPLHASTGASSAADEAFVLHPGLLDAALHAIMGFDLARGVIPAGLAVPFDLQAVTSFAPCPASAWVTVRRVSNDRYDVDLCDDTGLVCVRMRGLGTRRVDGVVDTPPAPAPALETAMPAAPVEVAVLLRQVEQALMQASSSLLLLPLEKITVRDEFGGLGFDSIAFAELAVMFETDFGIELTPTVFYEHPTIERFARYLTDAHQDTMRAHFGPRREATPSAQPLSAQPLSAQPLSALPPAGAGAVAPAVESRRTRRAAPRFASASAPLVAAAAPAASAAGTRATAEPIAIVGISGSFPQSPDVEAFWDTLVNGRDAMVDIPASRWDWRAFYGEAGQPQKTPITKGGFIEGVDEFDPLFFNISPREAQLMDPQQRLLLMHIWKAIEDAGYAPSSLSGTNTGIFVGMGASGYAQLIARSHLSIDGYTGMGTIVPVGPNRASYFLNLSGPSEPIDTMCSSSLVAIHRAVGAIRSGQCDMALVGGVNTILTPDQHISYSHAGMLGADGRCKPFSDRADGFGRGEGVGILFLKPLRAAEAAGDHVYGVILGSAENHGGRATSFSAPNPQAQAALLRRAYLEADIDPASVGYIEAHGTGTALGDPIEIDGLKMAFRELHQARGTTPSAAQCGIGSVKSNIGHLELAAGVAGVIKVLLQMRQATLAPTLHCDTVNPYIQLDGSPFYLVRQPTAWPARRDARGAELPRRAGVSAFGFGGVNAHVVLEEYVPRVAAPSGRQQPTGPVAILLSARDRERLRDQATALQTVVRGGQFTDDDLIDIAYTLQVGRDAMDVRLGFLVGSLSDLDDKLGAFLRGDLAVGAPRGDKGAAEAVRLLTDDEDFRAVVDTWVEQRRWEKLLDLWLKGLMLDWSRLYPAEARPRRVSLPTYPFARDSHWIPRSTAASASTPAQLAPGATEMLESRTTTVLVGDEFFLTDHVIQGRRVLPAVVALELARAATARAAMPSDTSGSANPYGTSLRDVSWLRPLVMGSDPLSVHVRLSREHVDELTFQIEGDAVGSGRAPIYARGRVGSGSTAAVPVVDLAAVRASCSAMRYTGEACYEAFAAIGYHYGPAHRCIDELQVGTNELLARLVLPTAFAETLSRFVLHPALADGGLQAAIGFLLAQRRHADDPIVPELPFEVRRVDLLRPCSATMWAWLRRTENSFDLDLCDDAGRLSARFSGWTTRPVEGGLPRESVSALPFSDGELILEPAWEPVAIAAAETAMPVAAGGATPQVVTLGANEAQLAAIRESQPGVRALDVSPTADVERLAESIRSAGPIDHLVWIVPASPSASVQDDSVIAAQRDGVWVGFRLIKALLAAGYGERVLTVSVLTTATQAVRAHELTSPAQASVHGLFGSVAKEYPDWQVRLLDLPAVELWPWETIFTLRHEPHGNTLALRENRWYRQALVPVQLAADAPPVGHSGDVIVVIGGAGGIGTAWTEAALRRSPAQFVWIGRRPLDETLRSTLDRLGTHGPTPLYVRADATDRVQLEQARATILRAFGRINGIVHAAFVLDDRSIANMTDEEFRRGLTPKVEASVRLAQVFGQDPLGFVLFFSSLNAFVRPAGQSNYAAGCAFVDAFAHRIAAEWPCRVRTVNWGYWGSVGAVAAPKYRAAMARKGVGSIEAPEATRLIDRLVAGSTPQVAYLQTLARPTIEGIPIRLPADAPRPQEPVSVPDAETFSLDALMAQPRDLALTQLQGQLRRLVAQELGVDIASLDTASRPFAEALLGEFGMDSLTSSNLRHTLRRVMAVDVPVQRIISEPVRHIADTIYDQLVLQRVSAAAPAGDDEGRETYVF